MPTLPTNPDSHAQPFYFKSPTLRIHPKVQAALSLFQPVVALESTIIAHGMPYPENIQNAKALEQAIISNGATPATVAVINGIPHIGLSHNHLHLLSTHPSVRKLSRRDLPAAFSDGSHGATTVSATMFLSSLAGIRVFATGGIGGVHRGVTTTFDISADLHALASIPQLVVCAGAKSILDIPKTLEALETASVPVIVLAYDRFPAFYTRDSGQPAPLRVETEFEVAKIVHTAHFMHAANGVLLAVPVPESFEADAELVQRATSKALHEMKTRSLRPNQVTPFLLKRIAEITDGASLQTNMHLARNNACVAARVAAHLSRIRSSSSVTTTHAASPSLPLTSALPFKVHSTPPDLLVVGGTALDIHCDASNDLVMRSSNAGRIRQRVGGVGKNVAEAALVLGNASVNFVSCIGDDIAGRAVLSALQETGFRTDCIKRYPGKRTGVCCVVHDVEGDLTVAVADLEDMFGFSFSFVDDAHEDICRGLRSAKVVCMDANFSSQDMGRLVALCKQHRVPVWFEPTTSVKCKRVVEADVIGALAYMSPNEKELRSIAAALQARARERSGEDTNRLASHNPGVSNKNNDMSNEQENSMDLLQCAGAILRAGNGIRIFCTRGPWGVSRFTLNHSGDVREDKFAAMQVRSDLLQNTTGAGDCFAGRCLAGLARGENEDDAIRSGIVAAGQCCMSEEIVPRSALFAKI